MSVIIFDRMQLLVSDFLMGNSATIKPPTTWQTCLAITPASQYVKTSVWDPAGTAPNIAELGSIAKNGYVREPIGRNQTLSGFAPGILESPGRLATGAKVTFGPFTAAPNPNGARSVVIADGTTLNAGNVYWAYDLDHSGLYDAGSTETQTPSLLIGALVGA